MGKQNQRRLCSKLWATRQVCMRRISYHTPKTKTQAFRQGNYLLLNYSAEKCTSGSNFASRERSETGVIKLKITNVQTQCSLNKFLKPKSKISSVNRSLKQSSQKKNLKKLSQTKYRSNKPSPTNRKELIVSKGSKTKKFNQKENQCSPCALKVGFKRSKLLDTYRSDNDAIKSSKVFNGKDKSNFKMRRNRDDRMKKIKNSGKIHQLYDHSIERKKELAIQTEQLLSSPHSKISLTEQWNMEEEGSEEKGHINLRFKFTKAIGFRA